MVVAEQPLLIVGIPASETAVVDALREGGLTRLEKLFGNALPQGAHLGIELDRTQLQVVNDRGAAIIRAPRNQLDGAWQQRALALKGTMLVAGVAIDVSQSNAGHVVAGVDAAASQGQVFGAIVGCVEQRPTLPLVFS